MNSHRSLCLNIDVNPYSVFWVNMLILHKPPDETQQFVNSAWKTAQSRMTVSSDQLLTVCRSGEVTVLLRACTTPAENLSSVPSALAHIRQLTIQLSNQQS